MQIYVPPPDRDSRQQIINNNLRKIPTAPGSRGDNGVIDMEELLDKSEGFSGAEVVSICNEAAIYAIDEGAEFVTHQHLVSAVEELKPQITPTMLSFYNDMAKRFVT
jgi:AAA family ATPase